MRRLLCIAFCLPVSLAPCRSGADDAHDSPKVLTFVEAYFVTLNPQFANGDRRVGMSRDGRYVYVARRTASLLAAPDDSRTLIFSRNSDTGRLRLTDQITGPCMTNFTFSPDSRHVYVYQPRRLAVLERAEPTGSLVLRQEFPITEGDPKALALGGPAKIVVSPEGSHVYSVGAGSALVVFRRDANSGLLEPIQLLQDDNATDIIPGLTRPYAERIPDAKIVDGLLRARGVAISPDGGNVYTTSYTDRAVAAFRRDHETGRLTPLQVIKEVPGREDFGLTFSADVDVSPDGRHVYVTAISGRLVAFRRNLDTGELTWLKRFDEGKNGVTGLAYPACVAVSPNGLDVFVASKGALDRGAVARFRRDPSSDKLAFIGALKDGDGGCDSLSGCLWLVISPDGRFLYTSSSEHAVAVFAVPPLGDASF